MGNTQGKFGEQKHSSRHQGKGGIVVGADKMQRLHHILTEILTEDGAKFKDPRYAFGTDGDDVCKDFNVLLESELRKFLKVELLNMRDNIYLVPRKEGAHIGNKYLKKADLCKDIAGHYNRVFNMVVTIKQIFDIEKNALESGQHSIAGICLKNVRDTPSVMQIHYCGSIQRDTRKMQKKDSNGDADIKRIDFNELKGLKYFMDHILGGTREKNLFLRNLMNLLERRDKAKVDELFACGMDYIDGKTLSDNVSLGSIKRNDRLCKVASETADTSGHISSMMVNEGNPIFDLSMCSDQLSYIIDKTAITRDERRKLEGLYNHMLKTYEKTLSDIVGFMDKLVVVSGRDKWELRDLNTDDVDALQKDLKRLVTLFFYTSLRNYHNLLDYAKFLQPLNTSRTQQQDGGRPRNVRKKRNVRAKAKARGK